MKKKLGMLLALCVAAACIAAGCGKQQQAQTANGGVMTIDWLPQCDDYVNKDSPIVKKYEELLGVSINFIYLDRNQMTELLNMRIASNQIPDVMRLSKDMYQAYIDQGVLADYSDDTLKKNAPTLYEICKTNAWESLWQDIQIKGKLYGIPTLNIQGRYPFVPIWRDDWLRNVGINKIPETLDEAEAAFYKFVNDDPDQNGEKDTYALSSMGFNAVYGAFGTQEYGLWLEKDGKLVYTLTMPEMKEALTLLNKWYRDGLIDPEFITGENKGQYWANSVSFCNGRIGFSVPGAYYHISSAEETTSASNNYTTFKDLQGESASYTTGKPFSGKDGKAGTYKWGVYNGNYIVMGKNVKNTEGKLDKILQIHEKMNSDFDFFKLAIIGIENEDYTYDAATGYYDRSLFAAKNISAAAAGLNTNGIAYVQNNFEFGEAINKKDFNFANKVAKFEGYENKVWAGLPSSGQFTGILESKAKEAIVLFITGQRSLDEFDQYVQEMNTAGLAQLTKEANEWYESTK